MALRDIDTVVDGPGNEEILHIAVRGKRGADLCNSMPSAVIPFKRVKERHSVELNQFLLPRLQRELFNTLLDELGMKHDREGNPRTSYSLRHTYICFRLMEGADINQVAKNCRTSVEMIEKYYGRHLTNTIDASAVNVRKAKPAPVAARKKAAKATTQARLLMFDVARLGGGAIGRRHAGVVELVDARDSKCDFGTSEL